MNTHQKRVIYEIKCFLCGKIASDRQSSICEKCQGPLDVDYDYLKSNLNHYILRNTPAKTVKYLDLYPLIERRNLITLGEGGTPLHKANLLGKKYYLENLYIKNESLNPTGAFKDRGSFVEINKVRELGYRDVCVASTGNMAASVAAYSSQAGLNCYVVVPDNTPRAKLAQALSYGANMIQVRGTYTDAYNLTVKMSAEYGFYLAGDYAFRGEGQKSLAYEVCEQMWFKDIDWVIVPVGMGTNFSYIYKGFWEYFKLGLINKIPRMVAVQADGAKPIVDAFINNTKIIPIDNPRTVCGAIAVGNPIDAPKVLSALKLSKGIALSVTDDQILSAQQELAKSESLYVEPSSATTLAAVKNLVKNKIIKYSDTVILIATGAGLKDSTTTLRILAEPPTIEPVLSEVSRIIKSGVLSIRAGSVGEKEKKLFSKIPSLSELKNIISREFNFSIDEKTAQIVLKVIDKFIKIKGKKIAKADLQSIIETVIQDERRVKVLEINDFIIQTSKKNKPSATVWITINGLKFTQKDEGVGPVDAAVNAITKVIKKVDKTEFRLTDFSVEIPTTGSDATVEATMVLTDCFGSQVVEKGTSPDVIVAAIEAYEKGYNELIYQRSKKGIKND